MKEKASGKIKKKRGRRREGDVVKVVLTDGTHSYARTLPHASFAFYDCRLKKSEEASLDEILRSEVLFIIPVMKYAVTSGRWEVIGSKELEAEFKRPIRYFSHDPIDPSQYFIWDEDGSKLVKKSECEGLECMAVWDPEHVEDRLIDHYNGRKNKWFESSKLK